MKVERRSTFCMRYMPTLRPPVRGSFVMTAGSVMNGAGSPGQQRWIGSRVKSTSSPSRTTSWHGARRTVFGVESVRVEGHAHALLRPELVEEERMLLALHVLEEERRATRLHGAVDDLG